MTLSRSTRTHLAYQFIILTLLFLGIGYNELLPDRKYVMFLAFLPMFCYQLLIVSCYVELLPVPKWMNLCSDIKKVETKDSVPSSPVTVTEPSSEGIAKTPLGDFADLSERIHEPRRWEKSTVNIGASAKLLSSHAQKSKSFMNLSESMKTKEKSLSREGSVDLLASKSDLKMRSTTRLGKLEKAKYREERDYKAKSWKPNGSTSKDEKIQTYHSKEFSGSSTLQQSGSFREARNKPLFPRLDAVQQQEESHLSKSYSFPFRQKRLETWLEMKETETRESNQSLDMPYWQTVGYNLAVKYEARRRRRAISSPTKHNTSVESQMSTSSFQNSSEMPKESKTVSKKTIKNASNYLNKIKASFSNLIPKKKEEETIVITNKALKPSVSFKNKNRPVQYQPKVEEAIKPGIPQYLSNDRPLIFYPKYIPFEKERFESDVQKKMVELSEEQVALNNFNTT